LPLIQLEGHPAEGEVSSNYKLASCGIPWDWGGDQPAMAQRAPGANSEL